MIALDLETYSEVPIRQGTYKYAENCEVMIVAYAFDDGPINVWDVTAGKHMPGDLEYALMDTDDLVCAHNAMFDRTVLNRSKNLRVPIALERWRCTMVRALAHSLPGKLDTLGEILNVELDKRKLKIGRDLLMLFCKPRPKNSKISRATRFTHPVEWERFLEYAGTDIEAMRQVASKLPEWNYRAEEVALWHLDQKINDRGFCVDTDLAQAAGRAVTLTQKALAKRTKEITHDAVASTTQRDVLLAHVLSEYGIDLPNMQASTLERRISDPDLPIELRELLGIRQQATTTSTSKYTSLLRGVSEDGRLRGTLQFDGASRTGRWAGRVFQPQNLPRMDVIAAAQWHGLPVKASKYEGLKSAPDLNEHHIQAFLDHGIDMMKADCADLVFDDVMALASSAIRGVIVAPPGRKLVIGDLASIESRGAAWLAGEAWKLQAFRDFDAGTGPDLYKLAYAKSFGVTPEQVTKPQRQVGKVEELMLQYQGGVGAFLTGAATYGIDLQEMAEAAWTTLPSDVVQEAEKFLAWSIDEKRPTYGLDDKVFIVCDSIKRLWRRGHSVIVAFWREIEETVAAAIENPGNTFDLRSLKVRVDGAWLRVRLPSGRYLCYPSPRVANGKVSYLGANQYTRKWQRLGTYGGKFLENFTQAFSRDVLTAPWREIEAAGYELVMHAHDENVTETPDTDDYNEDALGALMAAPIEWAPGLPLAAAGFETYRYRKE